jgi:hypothetical protein
MARVGSREVTAVLRVGLALLAAAAFVIGIWNLGWPEHFYATFPGVALTPPFAEHYARDFGGATVGIGIVLLAATLFPRTVLVIPTLLALLAFAVPHAWFHLHHVDDATPEVAAITLGLTIGQPVAALALLALAVVRWRGERAADRERVLPMEA